MNWRQLLAAAAFVLVVLALMDVGDALKMALVAIGALALALFLPVRQ